MFHHVVASHADSAGSSSVNQYDRASVGTLIANDAQVFKIREDSRAPLRVSRTPSLSGRIPFIGARTGPDPGLFMPVANPQVDFPRLAVTGHPTTRRAHATQQSGMLTQAELPAQPAMSAMQPILHSDEVLDESEPWLCVSRELSGCSGEPPGYTEYPGEHAGTAWHYQGVNYLYGHEVPPTCPALTMQPSHGNTGAQGAPAQAVIAQPDPRERHGDRG